MLVLSRKLGEKIVIPSCALTVTVLSVNGNKVRLGISAPADVDIYREEIWQRIGFAVDGTDAAEMELRGEIS